MKNQNGSFDKIASNLEKGIKVILEVKGTEEGSISFSVMSNSDEEMVVGTLIQALAKFLDVDPMDLATEVFKYRDAVKKQCIKERDTSEDKVLSPEELGEEIEKILGDLLNGKNVK